MNYTALALTIAAYLACWSLIGIVYTAFLVVLDKDSQIGRMLRLDRDPFAMFVAVVLFSFVAPLFLALTLIMMPVRLSKRLPRSTETTTAPAAPNLEAESFVTRLAS